MKILEIRWYSIVFLDQCGFLNEVEMGWIQLVLYCISVPVKIGILQMLWQNMLGQGGPLWYLPFLEKVEASEVGSRRAAWQEAFRQRLAEPVGRGVRLPGRQCAVRFPAADSTAERRFFLALKELAISHFAQLDRSFYTYGLLKYRKVLYITML